MKFDLKKLDTMFYGMTQNIFCYLGQMSGTMQGNQHYRLQLKNVDPSLAFLAVSQQRLELQM